MVKFKTSDVKSVGRVQISARRLRELADKLEEVRGTDGNEEVDIYVVPGTEENPTGQLALDLKRHEESVVEEKKENKEEQAETEVEEVKEETPKKVQEAEVKEEEKIDNDSTEKEEPKETDKKEEVQQSKEKVEEESESESEETEQPIEQKPKSEVEKVLNNEELANTAKEIAEKAYKKDDK